MNISDEGLITLIQLSKKNDMDFCKAISNKYM